MTEKRECFNSTLVRLKGKARCSMLRVGFGFQFHTGSIKRQGILLMLAFILMFQFHTGSIKRESVRR